MVTADSVKSKIRGLIDKSNAKTGHIDKDLTTAVDTLVAGYGEGGTVLPEIDPSVLGTANDLAEGVELIGGNGEIIKGSLPVVAEGSSVVSVANYATVQYTGNNIYARGPYNPLNLPGRDRIVRSGAELIVPLLASAFGDATAADVAAGKTFTSASGHKVVGTMEPGGGFTVTDDGAGNVTITSSAITDNNGNVVIA